MDRGLRQRKKARRRVDAGQITRQESPQPQPEPKVRRRLSWRKLTLSALLVAGGFMAAAALAVAWHFHGRYDVAASMNVPLEEVTTAEYPEDPAGRSVRYGQYNGRKLTLVQKDDTHFDFVLEPTEDHVAKVVFKNIDVSLMTPSAPRWCLDDAGLTRIALTDREWNRQQVHFDVDSENVEVSGGDGFEVANLYKIALAKNCLNAGLWEVILNVKEGDGKAMYYQGWFTFPLGQYRRILEQNTGLKYEDHWYGLEHWSDPAGTVMAMETLRHVYDERTVAAKYDPDEMIMYAGEQVRKKRTCNGPNLVTWGDMTSKRGIEFATFIPPGRYSVSHPWGNEYWRLAQYKQAIIRDIVTPASAKKLQELELVFHDEEGNPQRFIVGGVDLAALPQLPTTQYNKGLYMPMGIGVPPFYQDYTALKSNPPHESPYYSFLLDKEDRWIDHHKVAVDGPVMHRDEYDPNLVHLYLLSYERHTLVAHFVITIGDEPEELARDANGNPVR